MKSTILILLALFMVTVGLQGREESRQEDVVSTQLCDYWRYNFDVREYVCGFLGLECDWWKPRNTSEE